MTRPQAERSDSLGSNHFECDQIQGREPLAGSGLPLPLNDDPLALEHQLREAQLGVFEQMSKR